MRNCKECVTWKVCVVTSCWTGPSLTVRHDITWLVTTILRNGKYTIGRCHDLTHTHPTYTHTYIHIIHVSTCTSILSTLQSKGKYRVGCEVTNMSCICVYWSQVPLWEVPCYKSNWLLCNELKYCVHVRCIMNIFIHIFLLYVCNAKDDVIVQYLGFHMNILCVHVHVIE